MLKSFENRFRRALNDAAPQRIVAGAELQGMLSTLLADGTGEQIVRDATREFRAKFDVEKGHDAPADEGVDPEQL